MKRIIGIICTVLLTVQFSFSQVTDSVLTVRANVIRNEATPGGNTKVRIANMFQDLTNSKVSLLSTYANPDWLTALPWSKITSTPTTLSTYGITDAVPSSRTITINGTAYDLSANRSWTITAGVWGQITGTMSSQTDLQAGFDAKQDVLVSGTSIKTVGGTSLLGSGNIPVGTGTVTSASVTTANGVSGTVATATTTPAITLTLGAITPTSVNSVVISGSSTPTLAVTGTTTISGTHSGTSSGTNTGDQTSVTGNAGTATALQTARNINGTSFNGTADITVTAAAGTLTGSALNSTVTSAPGLIEDAINDGTTTKAPSENAVFDALVLKLSLRVTSEKTTSYTASASEYIPTNATSGTVPITLPTAPADGTLIGVKMTSLSGTNTTTITTGGSDVYNKTGGGTVFTLSVLNHGVILMYKATGALWYVIADDLSLAQLDARYGTVTQGTITTTTTLSSTDFGKVFLVSGTSADYTVTLPTAVGNSGKTLTFKGINALTKIVTFDGNGSETLDGQLTKFLSSNGAFTLVSDDANWFVINETPSWNTYTPTIVGFGSQPTTTNAYSIRGKTITLCMSVPVTTSTTSTLTVTYPSGITPAFPYSTIVRIMNNGTYAAGLLQLDASVMTLYINPGATAFTASGNKAASYIVTFQFQ